MTKDNFTMELGGGKAVYDPITNTLTLDNVTIDVTDKENGIYYEDTENEDEFIIELEGDNSITISADAYAVYIDCETAVITGSGSLSAMSGLTSIISKGFLKIDGAKIECAPEDGNYNGALNAGMGLEILNDADVTVTNKDDVAINALIGSDSYLTVENSRLYAESEYTNGAENSSVAVMGNVEFINSDVTVISGGGNAIYSDYGDIYVDGGTLQAETTDSYPAIYTRGVVYFENKCTVTVSGGNDTILGNSGITISNSEVKSDSHTSGSAMRSYGEIIIQDQSDVTASGMGDGIKAYLGIYISDSTVTASSKREWFPVISSESNEDEGGIIDIKNSTIKAEASNDYTIVGSNFLSITGSWVESIGGEVLYTDGLGGMEDIVIFQDNAGKVIGNLTLPGNAEVGKDMSLTIPEGTSITVPEEYSLINNGKIENNSIIVNQNQIENSGTIINNGTIINKVLTIDISDKVNIKEGKTKSLADGVIYASIIGNKPDGTDAEYEPLYWSSDNEDVAEIKNGIITAKSVGKAVITVSRQDGTYKDECIVVVKKNTSGSSSSYNLPEGITKDDEYKEDKPDETNETKNPDESETNMQTFIDVSMSDWYYDGVMYVWENGIMNGTGGNKFEPDTELKREMLAVILWNMEGKPEPSDIAPFLDVVSGEYYSKAVAWANENDIIAGYGSEFGVGEAVTRQDFTSILYRYAVHKGYDTSQGGMAVREFTDYDEISDYAVTAVTWAVNNEIISGMNNGIIAPNGNTTRAESATMLMNFCKNIVK